MPTLCGEKEMLEGETCTVGGEIAVPVRATVCGLVPALSVKRRVADLLPADCGANPMLTMQEAAATRTPFDGGQALPPPETMANSAEFAPARAILDKLSGALP